MKIKLVSATPNPEKLVYLSARQSRYPTGVALIDKNELNRKKVKNLIGKLLEWGHFGPFEHPSFTFSIWDVSRTFTHQLVRHRMATYDQQSLRYLDKTNEEDYKIVIPESIKDNDSKELFEYKAQESFQYYKKLVASGVPPEDARFILPMGTSTAVIMTMNARSIMHFLKMRLDKAAQWEIRECSEEILKIMKKQMPITFDWFSKNWKDLKLIP